MKLIRVALMLCTGVVLAMSSMGELSIAMASQVQKPRIAIKTPMVGDGVNARDRRALDQGKLLAELEAALLSVRKFDVVSRQQAVMKDIRDEQKFAGSSLSDRSAAHEGKMQAANFLIIPTVTGFGFGTTTNKVPNLASKYLRTDHGHLELNAQVVDTETGQIKATFYMKSSFATAEDMVDQAGGMPSGSHFTGMAKKVSTQMADQLLDLVFPVEIISIQGNQVFLNRGQDGGLKNDTILNVYQKGQALKDPHTGEVLGSAEELVGKIRVIRVNPKFTVAEPAGKSSLGRLAVGNIVRKQ